MFLVVFARVRSVPLTLSALGFRALREIASVKHCRHAAVQRVHTDLKSHTRWKYSCDVANLGHIYVGIPTPAVAHTCNASDHASIDLPMIFALWAKMGRKKVKGRTDLERGADNIVDLDSGLLDQLRVCLHRHHRLWMQGAPNAMRECQVRLTWTRCHLTRSDCACRWRPWCRPQRGRFRKQRDTTNVTSVAHGRN